MLRTIYPAFSLFIALSVVTGIVYPLAVTGIAQALFPRQSSGSIVFVDGKAVGSSLLGQPVEAPSLFFGRPSATAEKPYNGESSGGSNLGMTNPALRDALKEQVEKLRKLDPGNRRPIPIDLVTASASGLDPHISVAAAEYQVPRVARLQGLPENVVRVFVYGATDGRTFGILGEPRVNVLRLNLLLERTKR